MNYGVGVLSTQVDIITVENYLFPMTQVYKTDRFDAWLRNLQDRRAVARVQARIDRLAVGKPGDVKPVGSGVSEMRIDYGPGYRVYFMRRGALIIVLLCGGDKTAQAEDIQAAKKLAALWTEKRNDQY
jgi:putative addiction module killer protein